MHFFIQKIMKNYKFKKLSMFIIINNRISNFISTDVHFLTSINTEEELEMIIVSNFMLPLSDDKQCLRKVCYTRWFIDSSLMDIYA